MKTLNRNDQTKTKALMGLNQNTTTLISYVKKKLKNLIINEQYPTESFFKMSAVNSKNGPNR